MYKQLESVETLANEVGIYGSTQVSSAELPPGGAIAIAIVAIIVL